MRSERGQATVELALALPLVALLILAVVQVAVVVHDELTVVGAAREAARAAAVDPDDANAVTAASSGAGLAPDRVTVSVRRDAGRIAVRVRYRAPTVVPLVGALVPDVDLDAEAVMRAETTIGAGRGEVGSSPLVR